MGSLRAQDLAVLLDWNNLKVSVPGGFSKTIWTMSKRLTYVTTSVSAHSERTNKPLPLAQPVPSSSNQVLQTACLGLTCMPVSFCLDIRTSFSKSLCDAFSRWFYGPYGLMLAHGGASDAGDVPGICYVLPVPVSSDHKGLLSGNDSHIYWALCGRCHGMNAVQQVPWDERCAVPFTVFYS